MHTTRDTTDYNQPTFAFQALSSRRVEVDFSGGHLSSDGGALLLREADRSLRLCPQLVDCFTDFRDQNFVEHDLDVLLRQRILGLALGYEDINDHERLRLDPLMAAMCGRETGSRKRGKASPVDVYCLSECLRSLAFHRVRPLRQERQSAILHAFP